MRRFLACKQLVVLSASGFFHLINDPVRTKSPGRNFDLLKVSDLPLYQADTGTRIIDIELELLSGLASSSRRRPAARLTCGVVVAAVLPRRQCWLCVAGFAGMPRCDRPSCQVRR